MRFEWDSGVDDIILPSTDMTSTHLFIYSAWKASIPSSSEYNFSYYTHCYLLTLYKECGLSFTFRWLLTSFFQIIKISSNLKRSES